MDFETARQLGMDTAKVRIAIMEAIPVDEVSLVSIIIALADLQQRIARLLLEDGEEEGD